MFNDNCRWITAAAVGTLLIMPGCQGASNLMAGIGWRPPAVSTMPTSSVATSVSVAQSLPANSGPLSGSRKNDSEGANALAAQEKDPLNGFYPEQVAASSTAYSFEDMPRSDSLSSRASHGCSSGCCSR